MRLDQLSLSRSRCEPSLRGRFRIPMPLTGDSEVAAIKDALRAGSRRLEPFIANAANTGVDMSKLSCILNSRTRAL
jgi:hypothetical protein